MRRGNVPLSFTRRVHHHASELNRNISTVNREGDRLTDLCFCFHFCYCSSFCSCLCFCCEIDHPIDPSSPPTKKLVTCSSLFGFLFWSPVPLFFFVLSVFCFLPLPLHLKLVLLPPSQIDSLFFLPSWDPSSPFPRTPSGEPPQEAFAGPPCQTSWPHGSGNATVNPSDSTSTPMEVDALTPPRRKDKGGDKGSGKKGSGRQDAEETG